MRPLNSAEVEQYTNPSLAKAYMRRMEAILKADIDDLLPQNPYLLPAAVPILSGDIVTQALNTHLQIAQEEFIDSFLRDLAVFVVERACDGRRSELPGVDLEFNDREIHYLIAIEPRAGRKHAAAQKLRAKTLRRAMAELVHATQPVLGYCYGKAKTGYVGGCLKVVGPNFWYLISGNRHLYIDIIEIISQRAKGCRDALAEQEARANNRMLKQFIARYCDERGAYDWVKFVEHNSCDFDLNAFLPD